MIGVYYGVDDDRIAKASAALSRALEEWWGGSGRALARRCVADPGRCRLRSVPGPRGCAAGAGFVDPVPDAIVQYAGRVRDGSWWPAVEWTSEQTDELVGRFLARRRKVLAGREDRRRELDMTWTSSS